MNPLDRLDQLAAPDPVGKRYNRPPRDVPAAAAEMRAIRQAKVTEADLSTGWNDVVLANPITGGVVRTTRVLTLKGTSQPTQNVLGPDPDNPCLRVGFAHINVGDVVGYVPFGRADRAASGYDGVIVPHAGDFEDLDTGAFLSTLDPMSAGPLSSFWGTITGGAGPTYAWTGDPGYSGDAAVEVNDVMGIGAGTRVRMFGWLGEGSEPWFEYRITESGDEYTGGPGIDITALKISFDYDALKGLGVEGVGDAAIAVVKLEAEATSSLAFDGVTGEIAHALQAATFGEGMPTGIAGENLNYDDIEPYPLFDLNGHFHPLTNVNVIIHTTHGAEIGSTGLDANGHVVAASHVVPAGTTAGDMLYWNGSAWIKLAAPGAGSFVLYCTDNVPHWVS